jgi:hypothetical protein
LNHHRFVASVLALGLIVTSAQMRAGQARATPAAPATGSDDLRAAKRGRLANGLRYAIVRRDGTEPGFTLYMRVAGGFIAERRPGERGLVHLVEHLALKGSTHLQPGAFQRVGLPLTVPAPSAASTNWQNSSYYLSARNGDANSVDTLLMLFREIASELTFPAQGVEDARREVIGEMADKQLGNRIFARYVAAVAPGSPNDLIQAQNSDDVPGADVATLRALYRRLYRPDDTLLVIVGKVDPIAAETLIRQRFASWRPANRGPRATFTASYDKTRILPVSYAADPKGRSVATVSVTMDMPPAGRTREARLRDAILDRASIEAATARLKQRQPNSPPGKVGVTIENADGYRLIRLWDFADPGQWRPAVTDLRRQVCGLYATGWTPREWEEAEATTLRALRQEAADRPGVKNIAIAAELADAQTDVDRLFPPAVLADYAAAWLPSIDAARANARWRREWRSGVEHTRIESPDLATVAGPLDAVSRALAEPGVRVDRCPR